MPLIRSHAKRVRDTGKQVASYLDQARNSLYSARKEFMDKRAALQKWTTSRDPRPAAFTEEELRLLTPLFRSEPTFKPRWDVVEQGVNRDTILAQLSGFERETKGTVEAAINMLQAKIANTDHPIPDDEKPLYEELLKAIKNYEEQTKQVLTRLEEERKALAGMIGTDVDGLRLFAAVSELSGLQSDGATVEGIDGDKRLLQPKHTGKSWYRCDIVPQKNARGEITAIYVRFGGITENRSKEDRDAAALGVATQAMLAFGNKPVVITGVEKDQVNRNRMIAALRKVGYSLDQIYVQTKGKNGEIQDILATKLLTDSEKAAIEREVKKYEDDVVLGKYKPIRDAEVREGEVEEGFKGASSNPVPGPDVPLDHGRIVSHVLPELIATATKPVKGSIFGKSSREKMQMQAVVRALGEYKPQAQALIFNELFQKARNEQGDPQQLAEYRKTRHTLHLIAKSGDKEMHQRLIDHYHTKHAEDANAHETTLADHALRYFERVAKLHRALPSAAQAAVPHQPQHQPQPAQPNPPPAQPHQHQPQQQHQPAPVNYVTSAAEFLVIANRQEPTGLRGWLTRGNSVRHQCHKFLAQHNTPEAQALIFAQLYIKRAAYQQRSQRYNDYSNAMRLLAESVGGRERQIQIRDALEAEEENQHGTLARMCQLANRNPIARIDPREIKNAFCHIAQLRTEPVQGQMAHRR